MKKNIFLKTATLATASLISLSTFAKGIGLTDDLIDKTGSAIAKNNPACVKKVKTKNVDLTEEVNTSGISSVELNVVDTTGSCNVNIDISNSKIRRKFNAQGASKIKSTFIK